MHQGILPKQIVKYCPKHPYCLDSFIAPKLPLSFILCNFLTHSANKTHAVLIYAEFFYLWYCHKVIKIGNLYKAGNIFNRSPKLFRQMMSTGLLVKV